MSQGLVPHQMDRSLSRWGKSCVPCPAGSYAVDTGPSSPSDDQALGPLAVDRVPALLQLARIRRLP